MSAKKTSKIAKSISVFLRYNPLAISIHRKTLLSNLNKYTDFIFSNTTPVIKNISNISFKKETVKITTNLTQFSSLYSTNALKEKISLFEKYLIEISIHSGFSKDHITILSEINIPLPQQVLPQQVLPQQALSQPPSQDQTKPRPEIQSAIQSEIITKSNTQIKNITAIISCKGGVGKSTVASNLAFHLSKQGKQVGLIDADIYGPSIPLIFGINNIKKDTKESSPISPVTISTSDELKTKLHITSIDFFTSDNNPVIWRAPLISKAIKNLIEGTEWNELDYLIIDLPPGTGDAHISLLQNYHIDNAILVTTNEALSLYELEKSIIMLNRFKTPISEIMLNKTADSDTFQASETLTNLIKASNIQAITKLNYTNSKNVLFPNMTDLPSSIANNTLKR